MVEDVRRLNAADLSLPEGWVRKLTFRTSAWYDGLSSRWMDDVAAFSGGTAVPLKVSARANFIGLFGEGDDKALKYEVRVDGKKVASFDGSPHVGAPLFTWRYHLLGGVGGTRDFEIVPTPVAGGELHVGAVCTATVVPRTARVSESGRNTAKALEVVDHARGRRN